VAAVPAGKQGRSGSLVLEPRYFILGDGTNPTFTLVGPLSGGQNSTEGVIGSDLSASATQLLFNFSGSDQGTFAFQHPSFGNQPFLCFNSSDAAAAVCPVGSVSLGDLGGPTFYTVYTTLTGNDVIGSAVATPEPSSICLILAAIGFALVFRKFVA